MNKLGIFRNVARPDVKQVDDDAGRACATTDLMDGNIAFLGQAAAGLDDFAGREANSSGSGACLFDAWFVVLATDAQVMAIQAILVEIQLVIGQVGDDREVAHLL